MRPAPPTLQPCRVCVIGAGPGGSFFLHHLEERRRKWTAEGNQEELARLPLVTCFEKANQHGGNWRGDCVRNDSLWTNGPKENLELFDYTFADHFGSDTKLPVFLPRSSVLDYLTARVTRNTPDLYERYVQFNTQVSHVAYDATSETFAVRTTNLETGIDTEHTFDKCIWAAGEYGAPNMPSILTDALQNFTRGPVAHSTQFHDFEANVRGKHVLLVGGSYSALDMAYMAIKFQARKVTILVREVSRSVPVLWPETFPDKKVEILEEMVPISVDSVTQVITCAYWDSDNECLWKEERCDELETKQLPDVDTVILCTGFKANDWMLDKSVYNDPTQEMDRHNTVKIPTDWEMKPNTLTGILDKPAPLEVDGSNVITRMLWYHDCVCGTNPNFMNVVVDYDQRILSIDIQTYLMLSCIIGDTVVPSKEKIIELNQAMVLDGMDIPFVRGFLDEEYDEPLEELYHDDEIPDCTATSTEDLCFYMRKLAQTARDGHYPVDLGGREGLTTLGKTIVDYEHICYNYGEDEESQYKTTVHDLSSEICRKIKSLHTGNPSYPLKTRWLDLDHSLDPVDMVDGNKPSVVIGARDRAAKKVNSPSLLDLDKTRWLGTGHK